MPTSFKFVSLDETDPEKPDVEFIVKRPKFWVDPNYPSLVFKEKPPSSFKTRQDRNKFFQDYLREIREEHERSKWSKRSIERVEDMLKKDLEKMFPLETSVLDREEEVMTRDSLHFFSYSECLENPPSPESGRHDRLHVNDQMVENLIQSFYTTIQSKELDMNYQSLQLKFVDDEIQSLGDLPVTFDTCLERKIFLDTAKYNFRRKLSLTKDCDQLVQALVQKLDSLLPKGNHEFDTDFQVTVEEVLNVRPHPNADRLDIATVRGWQVVVQKGLWKTGDLAVYVPEDAIVPQYIMESFGLTSNRIKCVKLRKEISTGILLPVDEHMDLHMEVSKILGIHKREEDRMEEMRGDMKSLPKICRMAPYVLSVLRNSVHKLVRDDESPVRVHTVTEKLHGSWCIWQVVIDPSKDPEASFLPWFESSRGVHRANCYLQPSPNNVFTRLREKYFPTDDNVALRRALYEFAREVQGFRNLPFEAPVVISFVGEVFGKGIQKNFDYGLKEPAFRYFDVFVDQIPCTETFHTLQDNVKNPEVRPRVLRAMPDFEALASCVERVPVLFMVQHNGDLQPLDMAWLMTLASGKSTLDSKTTREGIVVDFIEDPKGIKYKLISDDYRMKNHE